MRYPARIYEPRWSPAKDHRVMPEITLKIGRKEEILIKPTRRGTTLLVTAGVALILAAVLIEAIF